MTLERSSRLESGGIDVAQALERVMGNEALLERLLGRFLDDPQYPALCTALKGGDTEQAVIAAHTLKGVCQNLGFSNLYAPAVTLTETLRAGQLDGTAEQFAEVEKQYRITMAAIQALD